MSRFRQALGTGYNGSVLLARGKNRTGKFAVKAFKLHGVSKEPLVCQRFCCINLLVLSGMSSYKVPSLWQEEG